MISLLVAFDENRIIGSNNMLPWHLPADLKYFKKLTMGHHIIIGRKTFDSMGKPLPGRTNVIITRQENYKKDQCLIAHSLSEAIALCEGDDEIFIIGGADIFKASLKSADKIYLTHIHHKFEGDTYFPAINENEWKQIAKDDHKADEKNFYDYSFIELERIKM